MAMRGRAARRRCALEGGEGLTEPCAGSDALGSMRTTATRDGDDYLLDGSKIIISDGLLRR